MVNNTDWKDEDEAIFAEKNVFFDISENQGGFDYF